MLDSPTILDNGLLSLHVAHSYIHGRTVSCRMQVYIYLSVLMEGITYKGAFAYWMAILTLVAFEVDVCYLFFLAEF